MDGSKRRVDRIGEHMDDVSTIVAERARRKLGSTWGIEMFRHRMNVVVMRKFFDLTSEHIEELEDWLGISVPDKTETDAYKDLWYDISACHRTADELASKQCALEGLMFEASQ